MNEEEIKLKSTINTSKLVPYINEKYRHIFNLTINQFEDRFIKDNGLFSYYKFLVDQNNQDVIVTEWEWNNQNKCFHRNISMKAFVTGYAMLKYVQTNITCIYWKNE